MLSLAYALVVPLLLCPCCTLVLPLLCPCLCPCCALAARARDCACFSLAFLPPTLSYLFCAPLLSLSFGAAFVLIVFPPASLLSGEGKGRRRDPFSNSRGRMGEDGPACCNRCASTTLLRSPTPYSIAARKQASFIIIHHHHQLHE